MAQPAGGSPLATGLLAEAMRPSPHMPLPLLALGPAAPAAATVPLPSLATPRGEQLSSRGEPPTRGELQPRAEPPRLPPPSRLATPRGELRVTPRGEARAAQCGELRMTPRGGELRMTPRGELRLMICDEARRMTPRGERGGDPRRTPRGDLDGLRMTPRGFHSRGHATSQAGGSSSSTSSASAAAAAPSPAASAPRKPCPRLDELELGSLLGEGAFARVLHARDLRDGAEYAVKVVHKRTLQAKGRAGSAVVEREFLSRLDHPNIARLHYAFQDHWSLYFVLELASGGELKAQISRMGTCSLEFARYYAAETVGILAYLRLHRIAHRDLKPENLLLTSQGHLKLVDFDAAVVVPQDGEGDAAGGAPAPAEYRGQPAFAGTSLYMPPEVLLSTARPREAFALDLWALGCIIYQMLAGETPFHASSEYLAFQRILRGEYTFPGGFPSDAEQLVERLLQTEPAVRPGMGPNGVAELRQDPLFGGSEAAFEWLLASRPPPRILPRRQQRCAAHAGRSVDGGARGHEALASPGRSCSPVHEHDFDSSKECTPEEGQSFLAPSTRRSAEVVMYADRFFHDHSGRSTRRDDGEAAAERRTEAPSGRSSPFDSEVASTFGGSGVGYLGDSTMGVPVRFSTHPSFAADSLTSSFLITTSELQSDLLPHEAAAAHLPYSLAGAESSSLCSAAYAGASSSSAPVAVDSGGSLAGAGAGAGPCRAEVPPLWRRTTAAQVAEEAALGSRPAAVGRSGTGAAGTLAGMQQWHSELARRGLLLHGECAIVAGAVVRRRLPCLRLKVLVLTDLPRLLVLSPSGADLVRQVDLRAASSLGGLWAASGGFSVESHSLIDFVISAAGICLRCVDTHLGAEEWVSRIRAALESAESVSREPRSAPSTERRRSDLATPLRS